MVVGATGGLGLETALQLAQHGADQVIVTGRTEDKANAGVKQIQMQTGRQEGVESLVLNLSDLKEVRVTPDLLPPRPILMEHIDS
jgi:NAD(P)-dependent dehydrogenase (short-subunit alcohol dehydrogenase family)